jgi:hypothetical protein
MTIRDPDAPESEPREAEAGSEPPEGGCRGPRHRHRSWHGGRKERVLHTRISDQLADDIRRMAEDLRVPVSNLVRNVLEEAFTVVETVTDNVGDLVEDVMEEAERARARVRSRRRRHWRRAWAAEVEDAGEAGDGEEPREPTPYPDVVGWQPLIFNQPRHCDECGASIDVGERGFAGLTASGLSPHALCGGCMEERRS